MQQYLFRGKRKDNGEWATGCLVSTSSDEAFILIGVTGHIKRDDYEVYMVEVEPETVGQFTGLKDVNGIDIYVGDIYCSYQGSDDNYQVMFVSGAFVGGKNAESCMPLGWQTDHRSDDLALDDTSNWLTIIGTMANNPELVNPPADSPVSNTMQDPNLTTAPAGQESQEVAATESAAQDKAMEVESAEEGGTQG